MRSTPPCRVDRSGRREHAELPPQRIEQRAVARAACRVAAQRLAHLHRARRAHVALGAVELEAGLLERQAEEVEQGADALLRLRDEILVHALVHMRGMPRETVAHGTIERAPEGREIAERARIFVVVEELAIARE